MVCGVHVYVLLMSVLLIVSATTAASMPCSTHCRDEALLHYLTTTEERGRKADHWYRRHEVREVLPSAFGERSRHVTARGAWTSAKINCYQQALDLEINCDDA
jgi:hypothetical protein